MTDYYEEPVAGPLENLAQDPLPHDLLPEFSAVPISAWGDPDAKDFASKYLVWTTFMGQRIPWHRWALSPLKKAEAAIVASGMQYNFYDVQSYNNRNIAGTSIKSNHAWAIAVDINPRENPYRRDNKLVTDLPSQVVAAFKAQGFKWGGEYRTVKDAMHFEYLGSPVKEDQLPVYQEGIRTLRLTEPPTRGTDVKWLQRKLNQCLIPMGIEDGAYGPTAKAGVVAFQRRSWPTDQKQWDGICGPKTWEKVFDAETEPRFIDRTILRPHQSPISGEMVVALRSWYGLEPVWTLTFLGAETSLGDPKISPVMSKANNFGCMKAGSTSTPWGQLSNGTVVARGKTWFTFPDPWTGMTAWGRLMKLNYIEQLKSGGPQAAAPKYYGAMVPGYHDYLENIKKLEASFSKRLQAYREGKS